MITKAQKDIAVYQWEEIAKGMLANKRFVDEITWFQAEFLHILTPSVKWKHDELLCEECGGDCSHCSLVLAGEKSCGEVGSWWQNIVTHNKVEDAMNFKKFYANMGACDE